MRLWVGPRGGLSTKIHMVTDAQGQLVRFALTGGQEADAPQAWLALRLGGVIADKGYESNGILSFIHDQGGETVIPPNSKRKGPWEFDRELYRTRNLIEGAFNKLKQWRRLATRYDRKNSYFLTALYLVCRYSYGNFIVD